MTTTKINPLKDLQLKLKLNLNGTWSSDPVDFDSFNDVGIKIVCYSESHPVPVAILILSEKVISLQPGPALKEGLRGFTDDLDIIFRQADVIYPPNTATPTIYLPYLTQVSS